MNCFKDLFGKLLSKNCLDNPVFIVGCGRSGTSVLLQAIGKHPHVISFPGEAPFLSYIGGNANLFHAEKSKFFCATLKINLTDFHEALAKLGYETTGGANYALKQIIKSMWQEKNIAIKTHWSAKTFPPDEAASGLIKVYPNAKFIYIVRNGIDVVHSMTKFHGFKDNEFEAHCHTWNNSVIKYRYLTHHETALFVKHEDLISNPETFFNEIFSFIGLNFAPRCINFVKNTIVHPLDQPTQVQAEASQLFKHRANPFTNWKTNQREIFMSICSESMQELGYAIS